MYATPNVLNRKACASSPELPADFAVPPAVSCGEFCREIARGCRAPERSATTPQVNTPKTNSNAHQITIGANRRESLIMNGLIPVRAETSAPKSAAPGHDQ